MALKLTSFQNDINLQKSSSNDPASTVNAAYTVSCDRGGDGSDNWSTNCDSKWSCGRLVVDCLDQRGCSTICTVAMEYYAPVNLFVISPSLEGSDIEDFEDLIPRN